MSSKTKKQNKDQMAPRPAPARSLFARYRGALLLLLALGAAGATWAVFEFVVWAKVPSELVGKWVVMEGPDEGGTIDFYRNGTMVAKVNLAGRLGIIEA